MAKGRRLKVIDPKDFILPKVDEGSFRPAELFVGMCRVVHYDLDTMVRLRDALIKEGFNAEAYAVCVKAGEIISTVKQP